MTITYQYLYYIYILLKKSSQGMGEIPTKKLSRTNTYIGCYIFLRAVIMNLGGMHYYFMNLRKIINRVIFEKQFCKQ